MCNSDFEACREALDAYRMMLTNCENSSRYVQTSEFLRYLSDDTPLSLALIFSPGFRQVIIFLSNVQDVDTIDQPEQLLVEASIYSSVRILGLVNPITA